MKRFISFLFILFASTLIWNCDATKSVGKKISDTQQRAVGTLGVNPDDYQNALNGDEEAGNRVIQTILTRPSANNGIGMPKSEVSSLMNASNNQAKEAQAINFATKVGVYLFGAANQPGTFNGNPNPNRASSDNEAQTWLRRAFDPDGAGLEPLGLAHIAAFEKILGSNKGANNDGAIHSHTMAATNIPNYSVYILATMLTVMGFWPEDAMDQMEKTFTLGEIDDI